MGRHGEAVKAFRDAQAHGLDVRAIHPDDATDYKTLAAAVSGSPIPQP
jgi:hypothetical protein